MATRRYRRLAGIPTIIEQTIQQINNRHLVDSISASVSFGQAEDDQTADAEDTEYAEKAEPSDTDAASLPSAPPPSCEEPNSTNDLFSLGRDSLVKGIIYSEIFGKPRALRRGIR